MILNGVFMSREHESFVKGIRDNFEAHQIMGDLDSFAPTVNMVKILIKEIELLETKNMEFEACFQEMADLGMMPINNLEITGKVHLD